jgi:hypothetical protein
LGSLKYTNVNKIFVRISKLDSKTDEELSGLYGERLIRYYQGLPKITEWNVSLPDDGDKQTHTAEFKLPELEPGKLCRNDINE